MHSTAQFELPTTGSFLLFQLLLSTSLRYCEKEENVIAFFQIKAQAWEGIPWHRLKEMRKPLILIWRN